MAACKSLDKLGKLEKERKELSTVRALLAAACLKRIATRVIICDVPSHDRIPGLESALWSWGGRRKK